MVTVEILHSFNRQESQHFEKKVKEKKENKTRTSYA